MEKVLFDPGYSNCLLGISENACFIYSAFLTNNIPLKRKKFEFSVLYPKIKTMIDKNIAFYLGCLLWACYIKSIKNASIEDNPCLFETYNEENALASVNELKELITSKLNRDAKYYLNKEYILKPEYEKILTVYLEFLKLNKGFVELKNTDELILPEEIKSQNAASLCRIKEKIENALQNKNLLLLYDVYELVL